MKFLWSKILIVSKPQVNLRTSCLGSKSDRKRIGVRATYLMTGLGGTCSLRWGAVASDKVEQRR